MRGLPFLFLLILLHSRMLPLRSQVMREHSYVPNELIIKIKPEWKQLCRPDAINEKTLQAILSEIGASDIRLIFPETAKEASAKAPIKNQVDLSTIYSIKYTNAYSPIDISEKLSKHLMVAYAQPRRIYQPLFMPSDPTISDFAARIGLLEAWDITRGDTNVVIGIVDTGINWDHPDLIDNCKINYADPINGIDDDNDGYVDNYRGWDLVGADNRSNYWQPDNDTRVGNCDLTGHGTAIAGIVAAKTNNGKGIAGVAFNCKFLPVKVSGDSDEVLVRAFEGVKYAVDRGCKIICCAWAGSNFDAFGQDVINYATLDKNALVVAAAGNNGEFRLYPAGFRNVLSVAGVLKDDNFAGLTYDYSVDVSAPAEAAYTDCRGDIRSFCCRSSYACAIVAGLAGLVRSQFPGYSALQAGERLRSTADNIYNVGSNYNYRDKLGKGRVNALKALTQNAPSVRLVSAQLVDSDNVPSPGDSVQLILNLRNYLEPTRNLQVSFVPFDTGKVMVYNGRTGNGSDIGVIGTLATNTNQSDPIYVVIRPTVTENYILEGRLEYTDGNYRDAEYLQLVLHPTFVTIGGGNSSGSVNTSLSASGRLGFIDFPKNDQGVGFTFQPESGSAINYLFEAGLMIGQNHRQVVDNIREKKSGSGRFEPDSDFVSLTGIRLISPASRSSKEAIGAFADSGARVDERIGIHVRQQCFAFDNAPDNQYLIFRYVLYNPSNILLDSLYAGLFADFDIGPNATNDSVDYDPELRLLYAFGDETPGLTTHIGLAILSDTNLVQAFAGSNITSGGRNAFEFNDSAKYEALRSELSQSRLLGTDVIQVLGNGPLRLQPNDSQVVVIAMVAGKNRADLKMAVRAARDKYYCLINTTPLKAALGPDKTACEKIRIDGTTFGAVTYRWEPGNETTKTIEVNQSGRYRLVVTDANGCVAGDDINITILQKPDLKVFISDSILEIGDNRSDTLTVSDSTLGVISRNWYFGDGFGCNAQLCKYVYQKPGNYILRLEVSNGQCLATFQKPILVIKSTDREADLHDLIGVRILPNPAADKLYLQLSPSFQYQVINIHIFNAAGQKISSVSTQLDDKGKGVLVPGLNSGMYWLQLETGAGIFNQKISIIR